MSSSNLSLARAANMDTDSHNKEAGSSPRPPPTTAVAAAKNGRPQSTVDVLPAPKVEVCFSFGEDDEAEQSAGKQPQTFGSKVSVTVSETGVASAFGLSPPGKTGSSLALGPEPSHVTFRKMHRAKSCVVKNKDSSADAATGAIPRTSTASGHEDSFHKAFLAAVTRSNSFHTSRGQPPPQVRMDPRLATAGSTVLPGSSADDQLSGSSNSNGSGSVRKKFKMKEKTKVLLKLHIIHQKAIAVEDSLLELQVLTLECQDSSSLPSSGEDTSSLQQAAQASPGVDEAHEAFISKVLEIEAQVQLLFKLVMLLCRHRFMERHASFLSTIRDQMKTTLDISVPFFGIDWPHILRVARNLVQLIESLVVAIKEESFHHTDDGSGNSRPMLAARGGINPSSPFEIDLIIPSNVLRNIVTIEADVSSHAEAVLRGRLSRKNQESIINEAFALAQERRQRLYLLSLEKEAEARKKLKKKKKKKKKGKKESDAQAASHDALEGPAKEDEVDSNLEEESEVLAKARVDNESGRRSLWGTFKGLQFALFRKGSNHRNHPNNDDLWRLWYMGLQSMTLSVSLLASQDQQELGVAGGAGSHAVTGAAALPSQDSTSNTALVVSHPAPPIEIPSAGLGHFLKVAKETPPPSEQEQVQVLGVYSTTLPTTPRENREQQETLDTLLSKEETLESLKILQLVDAPKQKAAESEL